MTTQQFHARLPTNCSFAFAPIYIDRWRAALRVFDARNVQVCVVVADSFEEAAAVALQELEL